MAVRNVIIIGSGPAGLTAGLYAGRANLQPIVIEGLEKGGQLMLTTLVENWPGFRDGIMGPDLMEEMRVQAEHFGAEMLAANVTSVDLRQRPFVVKTSDAEYQTRTLIIATGASARWLGIPSERALAGHGVSTCATCDGFFHRGFDVAVVGGGDSALEEALFLTRFAAKVYVIHRRGELRASKIMQDRALRNPKIEFVWNTVVTDVLGDTALEGLSLRNVVTGDATQMPVHGLFVAIGHVPNTDLFAGWLEMEDSGYLRTQHGTTFTNVDGVFAAGDVQDHVYRQAVTAAGSGCMAAIDAERWLETTGAVPHEISATPRNW